MKNTHHKAGNAAAIRSPPVILSARQRAVLKLVVDGHSTQDIAQMLAISIRTVDYHRRSISAKLNIDNVALLTKYAIREKITVP